MGRLWAGLVLGTLLVAGCDRGEHPGNIGKPAPQFVIGDGTRTVDLSRLRGKVVLLNLWASYCAPCIEELPSLLALQRQMPDLVIIAVSIDQDPDVYHRFLEKNHVNLVTVRDEDQRVNALYGTAQIPETYIIDRHGVLRRKFVSAQDWTSPEITGYLSRL
ncbi:MAG TPA: TlpA disulfide reductase family protein [Edaphobacter sp.]|nr:TlpA disulfide reductase family protein [Edaphobacter sp.]